MSHYITPEDLKIQYCISGKQIFFKRRILKSGRSPKKRKSYDWQQLGGVPIPDSIERKEVTGTSTKEWLGRGLQTDDINCSTTYEYKYIEYNKDQVDAFAKSEILKLSAAKSITAKNDNDETNA